MLRRGKLSGPDRVAALLLALVWLGAGTAAIVFAFAVGRWWPGIVGLFAVVYGLLWMRVAARSRLL